MLMNAFKKVLEAPDYQPEDLWIFSEVTKPTLFPIRFDETNH